MNDIALSLDVDWCPDFMIDAVAEVLKIKRIHATWFVTHESDAIIRLMQEPLFEIGIHPNFLEHSTHGKDPYEILAHMKKIVPTAKTVRTHGLFQSSIHSHMMRTNFDLVVDSSILLPKCSHIVPFETYYAEKPFIRLPFYWCEDYEWNLPKPSFKLNRGELKTPGLKIFAFHPLHIYMNSHGWLSYNQLKFRLKKYGEVTKAEADQLIYNGIGATTLFSELVEYLSKRETRTLFQIAMDYAVGYDVRKMRK
jgi:hypothetical protein